MKNFLTLAVCFLLTLPLSAQLRLDVEGDAKITGRLEVFSDPSNLFIGRNAGIVNTTSQLNTFLGMDAGAANTSGSKNTFLGAQAGNFNNTGGANTFIGVKAGWYNTTGSYNTFIGDQAGSFNTTGAHNTFLGWFAGSANSTGTQNTLIGSGAGIVNSTGKDNTFIGYQVGVENNTGSFNTFLGSKTGKANITGNSNVAIGKDALFSNTADKNTANGYLALYSNTTGNNNTANGFRTMFSNTTGYGNTANGSSSLTLNTTGNYNTALGSYANVDDGNYSYAAAIGAFALTNASEKTVIGRNDPGVVIGGYAGWSNLSDGRFKENVKENVPGLEFIRKLRPVTYRVNLEKLQRHITDQMPDSIAALYMPEKETQAKARQELRTGFVAQEVEALAEKIGYPFDGVNAPKNPSDNYSLVYGQFVPSLVKAVQEQQEEIEQQEEMITRHEAEIADLRRVNEELIARLERLEALLGESTGTSNTAILSSARLDQNQPNPFNANTTIRYFIPESVSRAELRISDTGGRVLQTIVVGGRGEGETLLLAHSLSPGHYTYTLVLDGQALATRQMVLTR